MDVDIFEALSGADDPQTEDPAQDAPEGEAQEQAPEEATSEATQEPPAAGTGSLEDEALFSDEALATPEGIKSARETIRAELKAAREERAKTADIFTRMRKREFKAKAKYAEAQQMHEAATALNQRLTNDINSLQKGDARGIVETLGRLSGRDGKKVFEEIALLVATDGKGTPESRKLKEIEERHEKRVRELEARLEAQEQERQERELAARVEERKRQLVELGSDASRFPAVAHFVGLGKQKEIAETLTEYKMEAHDQGSPISDEEAVKLLEEQLKPHMPAPPPANGGGTGSPHSAPKQRKPGSGGLPGQTLAPSLTTETEGSKRELTDEEHRQALLQDTNFWSSLGLE